MIKLGNIPALFYKQFKDTLKNLPVLVLYLVYPFIAMVMTNAMKSELGDGNIFLSIFATMHGIFTPLVSSVAILSEEKENNTLRVLIMSNVRLSQYFISIGGFILIANLVTGSFFLPLGNYTLKEGLQFLLSLALSCIISTILGFCLGLYAKNASAANGMAVPLGMVFAFLPMLAQFNQSIEKVSYFTYGQQISYLLSGQALALDGILVLVVNSLLFIALSYVLYKKSVSED